MYMQSEQAAEQAKQEKKRADWQQQVEAQQSDAARKQARIRSQRRLDAQASKAGGAGVVAGEGSLLVDQLEAASMAQYEEDLAAYSHDLNAKTAGFESKLFKQRYQTIKAYQPWEVGLTTLSTGVSTYYGMSSKSGGSGKTVATQKQGSDPYGNADHV
jgi:hypothetical protein